MSRRLLVPVVLCCLVGSVLLGQETSEKPPEKGSEPANVTRAGGNTRATREAKIRAALDQPAEVEFFDTPLVEAIDLLAQLHRVPMLLDVAALNERGIATDEPITLSMKDVSLRSLLHTMLSPLELTYLIEDEVMKITTTEVAELRPRLGIYDIRELQAAGFEPELLVRLIQLRGDTGQWVVNGGSAAIEIGPKSLIVLQTEEGHVAVATMLEDLTEQAAKLKE